MKRVTPALNSYKTLSAYSTWIQIEFFIIVKFWLYFHKLSKSNRILLTEKLDQQFIVQCTALYIIRNSIIPYLKISYFTNRFKIHFILRRYITHYQHMCIEVWNVQIGVENSEMAIPIPVFMRIDFNNRELLSEEMPKTVMPLADNNFVV